MFMALASKGRYQLACECENHDAWEAQEYITDSVVTHLNPATNEVSLYRATGIFGDEHYTDAIDVPGTSIHWELICSCKEVGFTPSPSPTPIVVVPTPTPSQTSVSTPSPLSTPSPTPRYLCVDYEQWALGTSYDWEDRVQWNGRVYEARDYEGTESDDEPGISNHWKLLFFCLDHGCCQNGEQVITTGGLGTTIFGEQGVSVQGMHSGGVMCCPYPKYPGLPTSWPILLGGEPAGIITIPMGEDGVEFGDGFIPGADEIYYSYNDMCYSGKINNYSYEGGNAINLIRMT